MLKGRTTFGRKATIEPVPTTETENPLELVSYRERRIVLDRKLQLKQVKLIFNNGYCTSNAVLRSISESGAKIQTDDAVNLPDTFTMVSLLGDLNVKCCRVWRNASFVGVRFET